MTLKKLFQLTLFILSAEIIYMFPFVLIRIFRPTFLYAFNISNTELGYCYTLYGVTAFVFYFLGGLISDKYQPKYLMSTGLFLTGIGGFIWLAFPYLTTLYFLHVYWGITTIFFFWSPLIKVARIWSGNNKQIIGYGLLEGGRGIVAAIIGTLGVLFFLYSISSDALSKLQLQGIMKKIYFIVSVLNILMAGLLLLLPNYGNNKNPITSTKNIKYNVLKSLEFPIVWISMLIVLTAYTGYRIGDIFTQYASDIFKYDEKKSAILGVIISYLRPIVCFSVIFLSKNNNPIKWIIRGFIAMTIGSLLLSFSVNLSLTYIAITTSIISTLIGVYTIRFLYFTILEEAKIPLTITGTVIGIISVVGFSPDIFIGPLTGYYLDEIGGETGYQYLFIFLLANAVIGLLASFLLHKNMKLKR